jgi:methionyl aminopeptidase
MAELIRPGTTTRELDEAFAEMLAGSEAQASFKGYRGFPASICASVDEVIVHGIPSDSPLEEGQILTIDLGVYHEGFHTDSAWTFPVGAIDPQAAKLLEVTEAALYAGIQRAVSGNRVGDIGAAVADAVAPSGFSLVREYAGHGVGRSLHEEPWVPNYGPPGKRERLEAGMTLAIEPMVNAGGPDTETLEDGWTVVTADRTRSAHFEHTVAITEQGPQILTGRGELPGREA